MKLVFILGLPFFLLSCHKDNITKLYSDYIAGTYYCSRVDDIVNYNDSIYVFINATDSIKLPRVEQKNSLDTIVVISTGDSTIKVGIVPCYLQSKYYFYDTYGGNASWYSGYFINDSIYFNYECLCRAGFQIKGKRK